MIGQTISAAWDKIKAAFARSLTITTGVFASAGGWLLDRIDPQGFLNGLDSLAAALHEPELSSQIQSLIGQDPKVAAFYAKVFGILMIFTRLRSIVFKKKG